LWLVSSQSTNHNSEHLSNGDRSVRSFYRYMPGATIVASLCNIYVMDEAERRNRAAWNERVRERDCYIDTATESDFTNPLAVVDPCGWLGNDVTGKRLLCLAAGGGR